MPKRIYVGNLPVVAEPKDLERACSAHGKVTAAFVKAPHGAVDIEGDAEAAAAALHNRDVKGRKLKASTDPAVWSADPEQIIIISEGMCY